MKTPTRQLVLASTLTLASFSLSAADMTGADFSSAQDLSCADIQFSAEMQAKYPAIQSACRDVVEAAGKKYAEVKIQLVGIHGQDLRFRFMQDDGQFSDVQQVTVPENFTAAVAGKQMLLTDMERGQRLDVYLPADRWAITNMNADNAPADEYFDLAAMEMLPDTASPLPLWGLAGSLMIGVAVVLRRIRRHLR